MVPELSIQLLGDQGSSIIFRAADDGYLSFTES